MLAHLHIRDFAIIDSVEIDLRSGLTVLTGETGAGKSILVDALQLVAGGRAGTEVVRHGAERAEVAATFELARAGQGLRDLLEQQSIEADDELVVRRVVTREGKSRAYLNGQQVPAQVLREVGEWLVDIHGQHEFQSLARPPAQRALLDAFAGATALARTVAEAHRERAARTAELTALEAAAQQRNERLDLLQHQSRELETLQLQPGEMQRLTEERSRLANGGRLAEAARAAIGLLFESEDGNAHQATSRALALLRGVAVLDPRVAALVPVIDEALIRIDDAAGELTRYLDDLDADPARQEQVEQRMAAIEALARKHRVSPGELPAKTAEVAAERSRLEQLDHDVARLRDAVQAAALRWRDLASRLSAQRRAAADLLAREITTRMQRLGMAGGRFEIQLGTGAGAETSPHGLDQVEFLVSANAGQPPRPVGKVASGGELSRLSLAVQVTTATQELAATGTPLRCMVFDEVDSGVGGAVAEIVGRELAALGRSAQVLCVTHLPQVAAQGGSHLRVAKLSDGKATHTQITTLEGAARVEEIARMLGGVSITDKAREHASEMLEAGGAPRAQPVPPAAAAKALRARAPRAAGRSRR